MFKNTQDRNGNKIVIGDVIYLPSKLEGKGKPYIITNFLNIDGKIKALLNNNSVVGLRYIEK